MNKLFTSLMLAGAIMVCGQAQAQTIPQPLSNGYIKTNLAAVRFLVNTPSNLSGLKIVTQAPWGTQNPLYNAPVVRGFDSLAALPLTNPSAIAGKVCLLFRGGGISFSQKADYAKNAGAIGVIIVNNIPGPALGMAQTGTNGPGIPVFMVSMADGIAMNNALINSTPVTISTSPWSIAAHDLGLVQNMQSTPHAMSIPYSQLSAGANRLQYRNFVGGAVANYGTSLETGITVAETVTWQPTTGASSVVHTGTYTVPNMGAPSSGSPLDSVRFGFGGSTSPWSLTAPTSTGTYKYKYDLTFGATDAVPEDNTLTYTQYVTDSIFCKGAYDYTKMQPNISQGIQPSGVSTAFSMGPLFYMAKGKFAARKIQYSVSKNAVPTLDQEEAIALLYKWVDGANGQPLDSFVEGDELNLVGINRKLFTTADSVGKVFTVNVLDPTTPTKTVSLDSNAWYWVSVQASNTCFIGMDYTTGFFTRSYIQKLLLKNDDLPELLLVDDYSSLSGSSTALLPYPFGGNAYQIDSTFFDRFYYIPALALHISKNQIGAVLPNGVTTTGTNSGFGTLNIYPNPANDQLSVELKLNEVQNTVAIRLLDVTGKIVKKIDMKQTRGESFTISCSDIPAGNYYLAVFGDNGHTVNKVSIKH